MDSGYREPKDRMKYSLRSNARYQLIVLSTGTAAAVYFFIQSGLSGSSLKALVMALAYAWGLILAIYLMGHGLVALPRALIRDASVSGRLRRLQTQAPKVHDKLEEAIDELAEVEGQIMNLRARKPGMKRDMQEWTDELYETSALPESRSSSARPAAAAPAVVTERFMAEIARKVKRARHKKARFVAEWDALVHQASRLQMILDSASSKRLDFPNSHSRLKIFTPYMRYHLYTHAIPSARLALGLCLAALSIMLVWSEFVHKVETKLSVVGLSVVHHPDSSRGQVGFAGQVIAAVWLLYMCTCALYSVSQFKGWNSRSLVRRGTYPESACWYSLQVAKLTVPLSYNFITMMPTTIHEGTAFYKFLGRLIESTTVSSGFSDYFPMFILIPVLATLFNLYGKIKSVVGFGVLEEEDDSNNTGFSLGGWREGRALIERELQSDGAQLNLAPANERLLSGNSTPVRASLEHNRPSRPANERAPAARRVADRAPPQQEEEDTGDRYFFQDFSERIKNTFDTTERPAWLREIGEGFKKPNWMNNDRDEGGGSSSAGGGNVFGRLFGGNASNGNVRL